MTTPSSRTYRSPRRDEQARETRRRILDAARRLFVERGYNTKIAEIAEAAEVSPQTVTASFKNKSGLLLALVDHIDLAAGGEELGRALQEAAGKPVRQIELVIEFDLRLWERGGDIIAVAHAVRSVDPAAADFIEAGRQRGREGRHALVEMWRQAGVLRADLSVEEATEAFLSLSGYDHYRQLVVDAGWSHQRFATYLRDLVVAAVLEPPSSSAGSP